jgi:hypothetical protein
MYGVGDDNEVGYVLHNVATGEDLSTLTEAEALAHTVGSGPVSPK